VSPPLTKREIADRVEYEGGVVHAIVGYGLDSTCLPKDAPAAVVEAWNRLYDDVTDDVCTISLWLEDTS
jgi:hypothetical protein